MRASGAMALPVVCVQESIADKFVSLLKQKAEALVVGCSYDPKTDLGPVVSEAHRKRVEDWIAKGVEEGAELVLDGRGHEVPGFENGFFLGPTIFDHVRPGMIRWSIPMRTDSSLPAETPEWATGPS